MRRREFLKALSALPFVGLLVPSRVTPLANTQEPLAVPSFRTHPDELYGRGPASLTVEDIRQAHRTLMENEVEPRWVFVTEEQHRELDLEVGAVNYVDGVRIELSRKMDDLIIEEFFKP